MSDDSRKFTRHWAMLDVDLIFPNGGTIRGFGCNISLGGLLFECPEAIPLGTECKVVVYSGPRILNVPINVLGTVVRCGWGMLGIRFDEIDTDAFEKLRNLLLEHSSDPERIDWEFDRTVALRQLDI
jgi:hypothetical protein